MSKTTLFILLVASAAVMGLAYYLRISGSVSTEKAQQMLQDVTRVIIDVRTPAEYQSGHLAQATNVPKDEIETRIASVVPDKNTPVLLYCRSGARSGAALEILQRLGYENAVNLGGLENARQTMEAAGHSVQ